MDLWDDDSLDEQQNIFTIHNPLEDEGAQLR